MKKERIDKLVVKLGFAQSRERARALIMAGKVLVDEVPVTKSGTKVPIDAAVRLKSKDNPYVSRGGLKLEGALESLNIDVAEKVILDIGSSTGGFTDCCLQKGAAK